MYIPMELIWFLLGFIAFPILCYAIYEIRRIKKDEQDEEDKG